MDFGVTVADIFVEGVCLDVPFEFVLVFGWEAEHEAFGFAEEVGGVTQCPPLELVFPPLHEDCHHVVPVGETEQSRVVGDVEEQTSSPESVLQFDFALVWVGESSLLLIFTLGQEALCVGEVQVTSLGMFRHHYYGVLFALEDAVDAHFFLIWSFLLDNWG